MRTPPMRRARKAAVRGVNRLVAPLETLGAAGAPRLEERPIFVVGPPRSGTTLLSQVLTAVYDLEYLSNLHNAVWGAPSWLVRVFQPLRRRRGAEFTSELGNTREWLGLSEAPSYWLRFFPESPHCVSADDVPDESLVRMRTAVARLIRAAGRPVLFKTVVNTGRIRPIARALPEAIFVVTRRDPVETAHSLLEARWKVHGSYEAWWSFEPPGIEELTRRPPHEQVIEQVFRSYERIEADRSAIGDDRFLEVKYESLCDDPRAAVVAVGALAGLRPRTGRFAGEIPTRFERRREVRIPQSLHDAVVAYAAGRFAPRATTTGSTDGGLRVAVARRA